MRINNTRATTAEKCMRKFFWNYEFNGTGIKLPDQHVVKKKIDYAGEPNPLSLGQLIHYYLANHYAGVDNPDHNAIAKSQEDIGFASLDHEDRNVWLDWYEWLERVAKEYNRTYPQEEFSVIQLETEGSVPLGDVCYKCGKEYSLPTPTEFCLNCSAPIFHYVFRIDLVTNTHGHIEVWDHKSTKSLGDDYLASWEHSMQMWGYCYGQEKATGMKVDGYVMNFIRKLKTIGDPKASLKQCPTCRNGSKKRIGCPTCGGEGQVERTYKPQEQPFQRFHHDWNPERAERFVRQRITTCRRIEENIFQSEPDRAWPCNPAQCHNMGRCPYINLCFKGDPEKWYEPDDLLLERYEPQEPDYVDKLAKEEIV